MLRKAIVLLVAALAAGTAAAQDAAVAHAIAVPFNLPEIAVSPDGAIAAVYENPAIVDNDPAPQNLPIYLYGIADGNLIGSLAGEQSDLTRDAAFSPDGSRLATLHLNGELIVWDTATWQAVERFEWLPIGGGLLDFSPDGGTIYIAYSTGALGQQIVFDLETGSITDIAGIAPATFAELSETISDIAVRGRYGIAAQAVTPAGDLIGASVNGEVFRWDWEARTRVTLQPESESGPARFNIRRFHVAPDGGLFYYDSDAEVSVWLGAEGSRTEYPFGALASAISAEGVLAYLDREDGRLYVADLTDDAPDPAAVTLDLAGFPEFSPTPLSTLHFTPAGRLVIAGLRAENGGSTVFVVELP